MDEVRRLTDGKTLVPPAIGAEINWWTVVESRVGRSLCQCRCGTLQLVLNFYLVRKTAHSCKKCAGLKRRGVPASMPLPLYRKLALAVDNALTRCVDPRSESWSDYGGRGIKVHQEWVENKKEFILYLATLPGWEDLEAVLDRIDNNSHYEPGNLRWTTRLVSNRNRRMTYGKSLAKDRKGRFVESQSTK